MNFIKTTSESDSKSTFKSTWRNESVCELNFNGDCNGIVEIVSKSIS